MGRRFSEPVLIYMWPLASSLFLLKHKRRCFFLLILFPSISDFVVSKASVRFTPEFASSIHDLGRMAAAEVGEEHNHILGYFYSFFSYL